MSAAEVAQALGFPSAPAFGVGQTGPSGSTPQPVQQTSLPPLSGDVQTGSQGQANNLGNLTEDQIKAYLGLGEPSMPVGEDVARTVPGAVARVGAGLVGLPGDLLNVGTNAVPFLYHEGKSALFGQAGMDAADKADPYQSYNYAGMVGLPTSEQINGGVQTLAGDYHKPQSWEARTADTAIQMAPMVALPGSAAARAIRFAAPTIGSEAAGEATQGTPLEPYARLAGALGGGGIAGLTDQVVNAPNIILANALDGTTPAQTAAARALMERSAAIGVPITPAEALGGNALRLQNYVENQRRLPTNVGQFFEQRPGQVDQAVHNFADLIAPPSAQPSMIGQTAQGAAQGGLDTVRQAINDAAQPFYDNLGGSIKTTPEVPGVNGRSQTYVAAPGQQIPTELYPALKHSAAYQEALAQVRGDSMLNSGIAKLPDTDLGVVNEVVKQLDRNVMATKQTATNPGGNNYKASMYQNARDQAASVADMVSPNWGAARDTIAQGRAAALDPLEAGPTGQIASTPVLKAQTAALYPAQPMEGAANETAQAIKVLQGQNPQVAADLTRQHVMNSYNEAAQDLQGGQNQYGGARWVAQTAGNPEQRNALETGLATIDPNLSGPYSDLADALRATGRRTQPGSQTAFNQEMAQALHVTPAPMRFLGGALDPLEWGRHLDNAVGGALYRRNINQLADFLTNMPPADAESYLNAAIKRGANRAPASAQVPLLISAGNQQ